MVTYQDLQEIGDSDKARMDFVKSAIDKHRASEEYKTAETAFEYYKKRNVTLMKFQKMLKRILNCL